MRFLEIELEQVRDLRVTKPALREPLSISAPTDRDLFILDRPDGATPRVLRLREGSKPLSLDLPGFSPRMLVDSPNGEILAVGAGAHGNGLLLDLDGRAIRKYRFGDGVADLGYDTDGNILVLRAEARPDRPLLTRFGPDGDPVRDDPALEDLLGVTTQTTGVILLVQNDGAMWLNLAEKYDPEGRLLFTLDPALQFGAGRVSADVFGARGTLVLNETGQLSALLAGGAVRPLAWPEKLHAALGRPPTAAHDILCTRGERLFLFATNVGIILQFRILSE